MTAPQTDQELSSTSEAPEAELPDAPIEAEAPEADAEKGELPEWAQREIRKANNEAQNLRQKLKEQEPLVAQAQEAERAKLSELEREQADNQSLRETLSQRDTELLMERHRIPEEYREFIGDGPFEEKEARAIKVGQMVQAKTDAPERPPTDRPMSSMKPGASPSTPPVEDHSYPANWGFKPPAAGT